MQFSVLKALIEFMYYGETRITEENLTSLIEAAKIFEVSSSLIRSADFNPSFTDLCILLGQRII